MKVGNDGRLIYSTLVGGSSIELATGIAVDNSGLAYVTGVTGSPDLYTLEGAVSRRLIGNVDAFIVKLNADGSSFLYSSYSALGGQGFNRPPEWGDQAAWGIAVDDAGYAYVTGSTMSADFPTTPGALSKQYNGGEYDAFVIKVDTQGARRTALPSQTVPVVPASFLRPGEVITAPESVTHPTAGPGGTPKTFEVYAFTRDGLLQGFVVWDPAAGMPVRDEQLINDVLTLHLGYGVFTGDAPSLVTQYQARQQTFTQFYDLTEKKYAVGIIFGGASDLLKSFLSILLTKGVPLRSQASPTSFLDWFVFMERRMEELEHTSNIANAQDALDYMTWLAQGREHWKIVQDAKLIIGIAPALPDAYKAVDAILKSRNKRAVRAMLRVTQKLVPSTVVGESMNRTFVSGIDASLQVDMATLITSLGQIVVCQRAATRAQAVEQQRASPEDMRGLLDDSVMSARFELTRYDFTAQAYEQILQQSPFLALGLGINVQKIQSIKAQAQQLKQDVAFAMVEAAAFDNDVGLMTSDALSRVQ